VARTAFDLDLAPKPSSARLTALRYARRIRDLIELARLHRPIGIWLLLWPVLWAVWIAGASHPAPRRVLVVGMSTGAWTRVITSFPHVERIDIVEINPGYLQLVARYPEVAPLLSDPRVHIHIDDGRRWLRRHPEATFDLVVQNTTYHWRANATNLLSREYFAEVKSHMRPGAIATFNTTGSLDVLRTAQEVFPAAFKFRWFVYVSDHDFRTPPDVAFARLRECRLDGHPAFEPQLPILI